MYDSGIRKVIHGLVGIYLNFLVLFGLWAPVSVTVETWCACSLNFLTWHPLMRGWPNWPRGWHGGNWPLPLTAKLSPWQLSLSWPQTSFCLPTTPQLPYYYFSQMVGRVKNSWLLFLYHPSVEHSSCLYTYLCSGIATLTFSCWRWCFSKMPAVILG